MSKPTLSLDDLDRMGACGSAKLAWLDVFGAYVDVNLTVENALKFWDYAKRYGSPVSWMKWLVRREAAGTDYSWRLQCALEDAGENLPTNKQIYLLWFGAYLQLRRWR